MARLRMLRAYFSILADKRNGPRAGKDCGVTVAAGWDLDAAARDFLPALTCRGDGAF